MGVMGGVNGGVGWNEWGWWVESGSVGWSEGVMGGVNGGGG